MVLLGNNGAGCDRGVCRGDWPVCLGLGGSVISCGGEEWVLSSK